MLKLIAIGLAAGAVTYGAVSWLMRTGRFWPALLAIPLAVYLLLTFSSQVMTAHAAPLRFSLEVIVYTGPTLLAGVAGFSLSFARRKRGPESSAN